MTACSFISLPYTRSSYSRLPMSLNSEMDDSYNRDGCHPDWIRKSLVDSGLNTPQSLSRWSIDSSDHAGEKFPLSRPQSPHSRDNGSRHENEGTHADRQAGEPFPSQVDKRPSLPPLRPVRRLLRFSCRIDLTSVVSRRASVQSTPFTTSLGPGRPSHSLHQSPCTQSIGVLPEQCWPT